MNFRTVQNLNDLINKNLYKIPNDIDLVVGIPRSGLFVANLIALYMNLPLTDFNSFLKKKIYDCGTTKVRDDWIKKIDNNTKVLIVEDSSISGNSLDKVRKEINKRRIKNNITFLTVYVTDYTKQLTDIYFEVCNPPRMFEWNYLHHQMLKKACLCIDGLLCELPNSKIALSESEYKKYIRNVPLRVHPSFKIGYLVTSRLEAYRNDTEYWLKKNGIKYNELIMIGDNVKFLSFSNKLCGLFKGYKYKFFDQTNIFVENNFIQAKEIAKISHKTVFCVESQSVIYYPISESGISNFLLNKSYLIKLFSSIIMKFIRKI